MGFHTFSSSGARPAAGMTPAHAPGYHRPMSEINVTPLVDVMLVLLVIFIVTAPLLVSSVRLDLPQTAAARPSESPRYIAVVLDAQGTLRVEDQVLSRAALLARLQAEAKASADTEVQLKADAGVPYGQVVELIGLAQQAGLYRVGFVAEAPAAP